MKCNQICKWNSNVGCVKPYGAPCILENMPPTDKKATNADRIRAMNDEGLAVFLDGFSSRCLDCAEDAKNKSCPIYKEGRYCRPQDIMEWLKQPMKGE